MKHTVSIVIPNWNGKNLLEKNIPAVMKAADAISAYNPEIIVIDDGSTDNSVDFIHHNFPSVQCIELTKNIGFHCATNRGFQASKGSIVLLLNSDIEPAPDAFVSLISHFNDPDLFGVNGRIYSSDKKTFLYGNRGGRFMYGHFSLYEKPEYDKSQNMFVCGGAGAFARDKFLALGGFDTLFAPFYYEEQDISYRALKRGWHIHYETKSVMYHQVRGSIGKKMKEKDISYISARNNYLFVIKDITDIRYTIAAVFFIPLFLLRDACKLRFRFWIAFFMTIPRLPQALYKRVKEQKHYIVSDRSIFAAITQ